MFKPKYKPSKGIWEVKFYFPAISDGDGLWERIVSKKFLLEYMEKVEALDFKNLDSVKRRGRGLVFEDDSREVFVKGSLFGLRECRVFVKSKGEDSAEGMFNCERFDDYLRLGRLDFYSQSFHLSSPPSPLKLIDLIV